MEHSSKTRLLTAFVIAVVFAAGVLIGFAADSNLPAEATVVPTEESTGEGGEERRRRRPIYAQLDPDAEQQAVIDSIIAVHRERTNALDKEMRRSYQSGFRQILLETREAIKDQFPPEQATEYQRLLDEWDAHQDAEREARKERDERQ